MMDYNVFTPQQLAQVLQGQRKAKKLTQKTAGASVGLLAKTISGLEAAPQHSTVESLFKLLSALELELVIRSKPSAANQSATTEW